MKNSYMLKIWLCCIWVALVAANPASGQWVASGINLSGGAAYQNSLITDDVGNHYVAFSDGAFAQRVTVKKLEAGTWVTLGDPGFAGGQGGQSCSMDVTAAGVPFVAVIGPPNLDVSVWTLVANVWVKVGNQDISEEMAGGVELVLDGNDIPYVLYRDQKSINGVGGRATVKKFNGLIWELVGSEGFSDNYIQSLDIGMDSNDVPYVVYEDGGSSLKATVKKFDGNAWVSVGTTGFTDGWAKSVSLDFDNTNVPYIAFQTNYLNSWARCMKFDGANWIDVGPAMGLSGVSATYINLAIDKYNVPYVAYKSEVTPFSISARSFDGTAWNLIGPANFTGNTASAISVAFDFNANPYVAFQDAKNSFKESVFTYNVHTPLPVRLVSFEGKFLEQEHSVALTWETGMEYNHDRFEIEAGLSPENLRKIGEVKGSRNAVENRSYTFTDTILIGNVKYYRLKQIDSDGSYAYSRIVSVQIPLDDRFYIKINPVQGNLLVVKSAQESAEEVGFLIYSIDGHLHREWKTTAKTEYQFNVQNLVPGIYLLKYSDKTGLKTRKFFKY